MKKLVVFLLFMAFFAVSCFSFGVYECLDSYYKGLMKCLTIFDGQKRQSCYWKEIESLNASLQTAAADKTSSAFGSGILSVGFFRNERKLVSSCGAFVVPSTGIYYLTVVNGNPFDKNGTAQTCSLSIWEDKKLSPCLRFDRSEPRVEKEVRLETGKNYLLSADEISPVASYVTVIVSDRKLSIE